MKTYVSTLSGKSVTFAVSDGNRTMKNPSVNILLFTVAHDSLWICGINKFEREVFKAG